MSLERTVPSSHLPALAILLSVAVAPASAQNPPAVPVAPVEEAPLDASGPPRIEGEGRAVDGRTLLVGAAVVRLFGLAAGDDSALAGLKARLMLDDLVAGGAVTCATVDRDRDGALRAVCEAGGRDLAESLIAAGAAVPARADTWSGAVAGIGRRYDAAEAQARAGGLGLWAALRPPAEDRPPWMPPWLWRIPAGLGLLAGSALGFLGLILAVLAAARRGHAASRQAPRPSPPDQAAATSRTTAA